MAKPLCTICGEKLDKNHTLEACEGKVITSKAFQKGTLDGAYSGPNPAGDPVLPPINVEVNITITRNSSGRWVQIRRLVPRG